MFEATWAHLGLPCIVSACELLDCFAEAADVDTTTLRQSKPALMQRLDWEELRAALAAQCTSYPAHAHVVRRSQCLHRNPVRIPTIM